MYERLLKRLLDIALALVALLLLSPVLIITSLAVMFEDGLPIIFRQKRVGRKGSAFEIYKFRSMPKTTGDIPSHLARSVKITRTGRLIRRTNIDELPQLLNILKGDMSIVGPRPVLASQENVVALRVANGASLCRPGLTGLAQINSYDGMPEEEKAKWDGKYSECVSLVNDVKIILNTFKYILKPPPVY